MSIRTLVVEDIDDVDENLDDETIVIYAISPNQIVCWIAESTLARTGVLTKEVVSMLEEDPDLNNFFFRVKYAGLFSKNLVVNRQYSLFIRDDSQRVSKLTAFAVAYLIERVFRQFQ